MFCLPICRHLCTGECAAVAVYSLSQPMIVACVQLSWCADKVSKKSFSEGVAGNEDSKDMDTSVHVAPTGLGDAGGIRAESP